MADADEDLLLAFLRTDADVRIYRFSAPSPEQMLVPSFTPGATEERAFFIWNTAFAWQPEFSSRPKPGCPGVEPRLDYFICNRSGAPLIEYCRHPLLHEPTPVMHGRIHWNTDFETYHGPAYDREAFGRWYSRLVRWIRKKGVRVEVTKGWTQYWFENAWRQRVPAAEAK